MNIATYIAKRYAQSHSAAVGVAMAGIAIGVAVMIITLAIVVGFKQTITDKIAGFGSHIQIVNFDKNNTYERKPITINDSILLSLCTINNIAYARPFITKPAILKTDDNFQGVVLKGVLGDDTWTFFEQNIVRGALPQDENDILISAQVSNLLNRDTAQTILCYFVGEDDIRVRRLTITGIYNTGVSEFDEMFVPCQFNMLRILNRWQDHQCSGIELRIHNFDYLQPTADSVYFATAYRFDSEGNTLSTETLIEQNPQIFAWLELLDMNVLVIIILMLIVSCFSMLTGLIILILESINLIGILRALGASNYFIRRIFITQATMLMLRGLLWGNIAGIGLCILQYFTHLVPLDPTTYYVSYVPISFTWGWWILMNIITICITLIAMLGPSAIASRISPSAVMRFE